MDIHLMVTERHGSYVLRYTQSEYEETFNPTRRKLMDQGLVIHDAGSKMVNMNALAIAKLKEVK